MLFFLHCHREQSLMAWILWPVWLKQMFVQSLLNRKLKELAQRIFLIVKPTSK